MGYANVLHRPSKRLHSPILYVRNIYSYAKITGDGWETGAARSNAKRERMLKSGGTTCSTERVLPPDLGAAMRTAIKTLVRVDSTSHRAAPIDG